MRFNGLKKVFENGVELKEFMENYYNRLIDELSSGLLNRLTLSENMAIDIRSVTIPASGEAVLNHSLKSLPKYRIILRQTGNGVITDGSTWDDKKISLKNNGAVSVTLTVGIFRS